MQSPVADELRPFKVPAQILLPANCPACSYSIKELPEPRCPECGERIQNEEVVILGIPVSSRQRNDVSDSFGGEIRYFLFLMPIIGLGLGLLRGFTLLTVAGGAVTFALFFVVTAIKWRYFRRTGWPPGTVTLSADGYRIGAGQRKGPLQPWSANLHLELTRHRNPYRARCIRYWGGIPMTTPFYVYVPMTDVQIEGLRERLTAWNDGQTRFRTKGL